MSKKEPGKGRGGEKLFILLESLPEQAQNAYYNKKGECLPVVNTDYTYTKAQREKGELRALAVIEHRKYQKEMMGRGIKKKTDIMDSFVIKWNTEHPDFRITSKSLYDWRKKSKTGKVENLADKRGGYNRGESSIPEKYQNYFSSLYLQQTKPSLESCFKETQLYANQNGDIIPGIKAFRLFVKGMSYALLTRYREGEKAFKDTCEPYTERDYSLLAPNDWWVADHHLWDVFVRIPDGKGGWKLARPWGSYWMDMRTRKMISSIIRIESPNSDVVLCSFGLGVEHFGVPKGVRLDNGKDYKAKDLFYDDKYICSEEEQNKIFNSLAANLQIEYTYAIPYNAKAKPIERVFNTFESQLGKMFPSYAGSNAKKRPEDLKDLDIMEVITLEEFIVRHNKYVYEIYNNDPHSGKAMYKQSPNHWYSELEFTLRRVSKDVLYFSLMRVKGTRVVGRNGITFNGVHFYNDNCINYIRQKVLAKYDPTKPEILYVFDLNENFLFIAEEVPQIGWSLNQEDYEQMNHRNKVARQKALNNYTADNVIRSTESIGERLNRQAESAGQSPIAKPKKMEIIRNGKLEETVRRITLSDIERNYEDTLKQERERKLAVTSKQKELAERFKNNMLERAYRNQA
ncbi:transposase domain-containing protein [Eisenbergiella tayi]|nr:transposase domain-containing protein [Eisenbergiella tayi]